MEALLLIALFLLAQDRQRDAKGVLNDILRFYRENRELIALLLAKPTDAAQQKDRPQADGDFKILEEFMKMRQT